jgi:RNA polymerase sigma-70 factor (ECF subfamily)
MELAQEKEYIIRLQKGDERAFEVLIKHYQNRVYSLVLNMVKNEDDAIELTQDVFIKIYQKSGSFQFNSKFSTWLFSVAYNTTISFLRKKQIHWEEINEDRVDYEFGNAELASDRIKSEERMKYIKEALGKMGEQQQILVQLFYLEELSMKEIEEITGIKINSIKIGLMRARQNLLKHLSASLQGEINSLL